LCLAAGLAGCAGSSPPEELAPLFWPPPPDTARIQYLTRFSGAVDFGGGKSSFLDRVVGTREQLPQIDKPYGLGVRRGWIYVCDIGIRGVDVIDLAESTFDHFIPTRQASLTNPASCRADSRDGRLYVADAAGGRVMVFDSTLAYVTAFAGGEGAKPTDVAIDGERIWVSDIGTSKVRAYDRQTHDLLLQFPGDEPGDSAFLVQPTHIAVADGEVYVSDGLTFNVRVYDSAGNLLRVIGELGRGPGQFARPKGIAVDRDGRLYVVDTAFENVQVFDREGQLLTFFGGGYQGPGYLYMPVKVVVDYENLEYFQQYVDPRYSLKHLIYVTNQFGPDPVTVYGFVEPREPGSGAR
jgi:DNA-binding beta-propeller fold protein YncE